MMQPRILAAKPSPAKVASQAAPDRDLPLSVIYADALYQPVPPVEYDDDGYPGPDSKVTESMRHLATTVYGYYALETWFSDRPETLVAKDLMLLFEEGNPEAALAPDVMVIFDAGTADRSSYKVWQEGGRVPDFVLEVLSKSTWRKDVRVKPGLYAALGVHELWLFEPFGLDLAGYRLRDGTYESLRPLPDGGLPSRILGLDVVVEGHELRFRNPATGEVLPSHTQSESRRRQAESARDQAESARDEAESARRAAEERAIRAERRTAELEALLARSK